jgi:peptidyl-prolyl cis-trans isomerase D
MLEFLRKRAQSFLIQAIVVIIALVFIFWGVGTNMMNRQEAAIVVDDEEISFQQFQQAYDQAYAGLAQQFGGTLPKGLAETLNIKQQVISQLTQEALLRQGGQEMGLAVSSSEIQNEIESMIQFQNNGRFDLERYRAILASNRLSPEKYEQSLTHDLLGNKTIGAIGAFAQATTDFEIDDLYNLERETVSVSFAVIAPDSFIDEVTVDDAELAAWYEANGDAYQTEKEVQLSYLPFLYSDIGSRITIEDEQISSYYDDHITEYQIPEKRHARHILLRATPEDPEEAHQKQLARAEEVLAKAQSGEDFASLAQQYSEGPTSAAGGDLGFFTRGQMVKPFDDAVFSMEPGQTSEVVKTDFGYHVIKLEEIQLGGVKSLDDARAEIIAQLQLEQARPLAFQMANEAYENIIGAGSLAAYLMQQPEAQLVETGFFKRSAPPSGVTADPAFLDTAFTLQEKELSSILETGDGYVILSATAIKEPEVPGLEAIRDEVEQDFRAQKAAEKAEEIAIMVISDARPDGSGFEEALAAKGLTLESSGKLIKNDPAPQSSFPPSLVPEVFRLSQSAPVSAQPGLVDNRYYVFRFDQRTPPETPLSEEDRARYQELLVQFKQQQILDAWLKNRQATADIRIHKSLENF